MTAGMSSLADTPGSLSVADQKQFRKKALLAASAAHATHDGMSDLI